MTYPRNALPDRIETARLLLREPVRDDVPALVRLADNPRIAERLLRLPHPYTRADGLAFVEILAPREDNRVYAITRGGTFVGIVSLMFSETQAPELGYWLGEPFWGDGLMSEALGALLAAAAATGAFPVIRARALASNGASLRILQKSGFVRTGSVLEASAGRAPRLHVHLLLEDRP